MPSAASVCLLPRVITQKNVLDTETNLSVSRQSYLPAVYNLSPGEISLQGAVAASNVTQSEHPLDRAKTFSFFPKVRTWHAPGQLEDTEPTQRVAGLNHSWFWSAWGRKASNLPVAGDEVRLVEGAQNQHFFLQLRFAV